MLLNTDSYRFLARKIQNLQNRGITFNDQKQLMIHREIQNKLFALQSYFDETAILFEENENDSRSMFTDGKFRTSHYENVNIPALLTKQDKKSYFGFGFQYNFKEASIGYQNDLIDADLRVDIGDAKMNVDAEFSLWKNKQWNPNFKAELDADVALASANLQTTIGKSNVNATLDARGAIGALYADATCVLSMEEQTFKAGIGACALKGEASIAFNIFGVKITLTGQGSIGSAEANIEYSHKNKEWIFGSKLGFIAGLGFKIRINY